MMGVVINDAIVMVSKIEALAEKEGEASLSVICEGAGSRLRAVVITTVTTVVAILPTAYGFFGYDSMLAEMMLTMGWGLALFDFDNPFSGALPLYDLYPYPPFYGEGFGLKSFGDLDL